MLPLDLVMTCNEPLFCEAISQTMKMSSSHSSGFVDPISLTFNSQTLEIAALSAVRDSHQLNNRVTAFLPLCRSLACECHTAVQSSNSPDILVTDDVIKIIGCHHGRVSALVSGCPDERVIGLMSVTARLEWIIGCLVERRLQLKDNLESADIREKLGVGVVLVLQCLIGCVKGFNLKNLSWHGFVSPTNVPTELYSLLFCTVLTLAKRITKAKLKLRDETSLPNLSYKKLLPSPPFESFETAITSSSLIHPDHVNLWLKLLEMSRATWDDETSPNMINAVSLNVVLFQQCLRRLWITLSRSDKSRCSAQNDEFYLTMDEMFAPTELQPALVPERGPRSGASYYTSVYTDTVTTDNSHNVLMPCLGLGRFHAFLDIFIHGSGLRLRDKLSHAECTAIGHDVFKHIFCLTFSLLSDFCTPGVVVDPSVSSYCIEYQHQFHPESTILKSVSDIERCSDKLDEFVTDTQFVDGLVGREEHFVIKLKELSLNVSAVVSEHSFKRIPLFIGPAKMKYYSVLLDILKNINNFVNSLVIISNDKLKLFEDRKLRSRQRQNFFMLVRSLPSFISVLRLSAALVSCVATSIESLDDFEFENNKDMIKVLKCSLKSFENHSTIVFLSKWIEINRYFSLHLVS